eukprot:352530-Chlamydomonas_euryale.AAC.3
MQPLPPRRCNLDTSAGELSLFESGAILLHLYAKHGGLSQEQLSKAYQWTLFANSTLVEAFMKSSQA